MAEQHNPVKRWAPFAAGVLTGLIAGVIGIIAWAATAEPVRHRRGAVCNAPQPRAYPPLQESELDEELAQSFPASDPGPHPHQVD